MKIFQFFFIVFFSFGYGQKVYDFDYYFNYNSISKDYSHSKEYFVYSKSKDYYLTFFIETDQLKAKLIDIDSKKIFIFTVIKEKTNNNYNFVYEKSRNLIDGKKKNLDFKFTKVDNDTLKLEIYKNEKRKKILQSHLLTIAPANHPLFFVYRITEIHPFEHISELDFPENFVVKKSSLNSNFQINRSSNLKNYKTVNLELKIPQTEIY